MVIIWSLHNVLSFTAGLWIEKLRQSHEKHSVPEKLVHVSKNYAKYRLHLVRDETTDYQENTACAEFYVAVSTRTPYDLEMKSMSCDVSVLHGLTSTGVSQYYRQAKLERPRRCQEERRFCRLSSATIRHLSSVNEGRSKKSHCRRDVVHVLNMATVELNLVRTVWEIFVSLRSVWRCRNELEVRSRSLKVTGMAGLMY